MPPAAVSLERLAGAALGNMVGDTLGMPVEGLGPDDITAAFGRLDRLLDGRLPAGSYTDDSQMMIGILETLAERGALDPQHLASRFAANYQPWRGYGGRIAGVMARINQGLPWDRVGTDSFGNGGAMRVGVLGAYFADDEEALLAAALTQSRITHTHPRGLAGAALQALAVGLACRLAAAGQNPAQAAFVEHLAARVEAIDGHSAGLLRAMPPLPLGAEKEARDALCRVYARDVTAPQSVPAAIGSFLAAQSAEQTVVLSVSLGGDTDTIGAMAGAIAGAYWGMEALPTAWRDKLEGRDYVLELCRQTLARKSG